MLRFLLVSAPIFAVVAVGFGAARVGWLSSTGIAAFAAYAFDLALPALVLGTLARQPLHQVFDGAFFVAFLGAGLVVFTVTAGVSAAARARLRIVGSQAQAATNGNLGFLGVPLILAILGERASGPLAMAIVAEVGVLLSLGVVLMSLGSGRGGGVRGALRDVARATLGNPIVLGVLAGAAVGLAEVTLPAPVDRFLSFVGASAGPTALFALGGSLAGRKVGPDRWPALAVAAAKLALYPALAWALLRAAGQSPDRVAAGVLVAALPTAANAYVFAERYDAQPGRISAEVLLSTLVAAATFPFIASLVVP